MRQQSRVRTSPALRLVANERLRAQIEAEGRRLKWLAGRLGMSRAHISRIVSGERTISEADARVLSVLINGDVAVLFDLPDDSRLLTESSA